MKDSIRVVVPDCLYFGGDVVHGVVELTVVKKLKSRGVRLLFAAFEYTRWTEADGDTSSTRSERRVFLAHRIDFAGSQKDRDSKKNIVDKVGPGLYRWPFAIALPYLIPPSCRLAHGKIEYSMCAYVNVAMAFDLKHKVKLNIGGNLYDQVEYCRAVPPIIKNKDKKFLFASGKLKMEALIPKKNLFVGEIVPIQITVRNASKKPVEAVKIDLVGRQCFSAHGTKAVKTTKNYKKKYDVQFRGKTDDTTTIEYIVTSDTPTFGAEEQVSLVHPKIVQLLHFIRIRLIIPWAINVELKIPINIMRINPRAPMVMANAPMPLNYYIPPILAIPEPNPSYAFPAPPNNNEAPSSHSLPLPSSPLSTSHTSSSSDSPSSSSISPSSFPSLPSYPQASSPLPQPLMDQSNPFSENYLGQSPMHPTTSANNTNLNTYGGQFTNAYYGQSPPGQFTTNPSPRDRSYSDQYTSYNSPSPFGSFPADQSTNPFTDQSMRHAASQPFGDGHSTTNQSTNPNPNHYSFMGHSNTVQSTNQFQMQSTTPAPRHHGGSFLGLPPKASKSRKSTRSFIGQPTTSYYEHSTPSFLGPQPVGSASFIRTPTPSAPYYPVLNDYQYPRDTTTISLAVGEHQVDEDEANLLDQ